MTQAPAGTVLVIEDEWLIALFIEVTLTAVGCHVEVAGNGREALVLSRTITPDLVVMDMRLPGRPQGAELLRELREIAGALPCVVVTGYHLTPEERGSLDLVGGGAAVPVLEKPFHPDDLIDAVMTRLGRR